MATSQQRFSDHTFPPSKARLGCENSWFYWSGHTSIMYYVLTHRRFQTCTSVCVLDTQIAPSNHLRKEWITEVSAPNVQEPRCAPAKHIRNRGAPAFPDVSPIAPAFLFFSFLPQASTPPSLSTPSPGPSLPKRQPSFIPCSKSQWVPA